MTRGKTGIVLGLVVSSLGCGPTGGVAGGTGTGGGTGRGGTGGAAAGGAGATDAAPGTGLTWTDDGVPQSATHVLATRVTDSRFDFLEVAGTQIEGTGLVLSISIPPPGSLVGGSTYLCNPDASSAALFAYSTAAGAGATRSCTITISEPGAQGLANAVGSFEAEVELAAGGTKQITGGTFDVPVMAPRN